MRVVVCLKQIIDPEIPPRDFKIDPQAKKPVQGKASLVIGPFDENALEVALQLKDKDPETQVVALTLGPKTAEEALRKALATRADEAVHVSEEGLGDLDSTGIARLLAAAIQATGGADLVLCGRQAGDWDIGQVGQLVAEELGVPCVTGTLRAEAAGGALRLRREVEGGVEIVEVQPPVVASVTNDDANQLRIPKVKDVMTSYKKEIKQFTAADLGLDPAELAKRRVEIEELVIPVRESVCEIIEGETTEEKVTTLARKILELKVL